MPFQYIQWYLKQAVIQWIDFPKPDRQLTRVGIHQELLQQ